MYWEQSIEYASISDIGFRRKMNQDSYRVQICSDRSTWENYGHLFVVCDGMGGHAVGELASKIAIDTIPHAFFKSRDSDAVAALKKSVELANTAINDRGTQNHDFDRMGTTCSALALTPGGAVIGHVGDSRVYRIRDEEIEQLTFDHSLQWELLRQGTMSAEEIFLKEPRNVITRSLGPMADVQVDTEGPFPIEPDDVFLLCSDGLTGHVSDAEIGMVAGNLPPGDACRMLIHLANLRGGSDNITVVIARVGKVPRGLELSKDPANSENASPVGPSWWWLTAFWGIAALFVLSACLLILRMWVPATYTAAVAVTAAGISVLYGLRNRRLTSLFTEPVVENESESPYRNAPAKLIPEFLSHIAALESVLQHSGHDEAWEIDWPRHQTASRNAQSYLANERYTEALSEFAIALDALMAGVQLNRKHREHEARWGKPPRIIPRPGEKGA